jgi:hypothetical protein
MMIIDSQVHAYEANTPKRPWHSVPNWPDHVTGDEMVAAMDKVGVDGAIFISAFSMYRYDASYAVEVQRAHPIVCPSHDKKQLFQLRRFSGAMMQPFKKQFTISSGGQTIKTRCEWAAGLKPWPLNSRRPKVTMCRALSEARRVRLCTQAAFEPSLC